jgi:hypothetical protein
MEIFTIDQLFAQMFPWLAGISWDLGTILTSIVFLWFLLLAFDWVKVMVLGRWESNRHYKWADKFSSAAEEARAARDTNNTGSVSWKEQDLVYHKFLNKAAESRVKGWKY